MHKVSIHIDGGYFLKRLPNIRADLNENAQTVTKALEKCVQRHLEKLNEIYRLANPYALLYRVFYYDARPFADAQRYPVSGQRLNYATSPEAIFRKELFASLRRRRKFALRLGQTVKESGWRLSEEASKELISGQKEFSDESFSITLRQKGVDMRMGIDITSICLKKQAQTIILVTGDSDFVPAAKLARREGIEIILDPMWRNVKPELHEHIDGLYNGLPFKEDGQKQ